MSAVAATRASTALSERAAADRLARALATLAAGAFALATALMLVLHLDPRWGGDASPVTAMLSDYAYAPG